MSDLREELEKNFASAAEQSEENAVELKESNEETALQMLDQEDVITAPKSYTKQFQESFKELSPDWQKYLLEREKQTEKGFSEMGNKLNASKWPDKFFDERRDRLNGLGFEHAKDYFEKLVFLDDAMQQDPVQTLSYLAKAYGIANDNNASKPMSKAQFEIWSDIARAQEEFQKRQNDAAFFDVSQFERAVDDKGEKKHPYYGLVKNEMIGALKGGEALSLEEAYQKALWLNEQTRDKMIEDKIKNILDRRFEEAIRAKEASFSPKSKTEAEPKELSLREELEAQFRKEF